MQQFQTCGRRRTENFYCQLDVGSFLPCVENGYSPPWCEILGIELNRCAVVVLASAP